MANEITGYELSRMWFNWCFENPDLITGNHTALYFFCIEHCNRLGWKSKFGLPTEMAKEAIGIKSYNTYIKCLTDLVDWGFIKMVERSKNQFSSNIIALSKNDKATNKALDKASVKHLTKQLPKQGESNYQSTSSIDKPLTNNIEPLNKEQEYRSFAHLKISVKEFNSLIEDGFSKTEVDEILDAIENYSKNKNYRSLYLTAKKWLKAERKRKPPDQKKTYNDHLQKAAEARQQSDQMIDQLFKNDGVNDNK